MLWLAALAALAIGMFDPAPAQANECNFDGEVVPCRTQNGAYRIRTPEGSGPYPAVVYLYGSLGNSAQTIGNEGFVQAFVERGYAVIVPIALDVQYRDGVIGSGWNLRNYRGRKPRNETAFVREVLEDAEFRHRIDRNRVLMAGMSNGGFLAWEIACHNPDMATAYAPVAAGYMGRIPSRCAGPVKLLHTHGRADDIVPFDPKTPFRSGGAVMTPISKSLAAIGGPAGCSTETVKTRLREYDRTTLRDCEPGSKVELLVHDGGHTIPLSWFSTVVDWFEQNVSPRRGLQEQSSATSTPRFQGVTTGFGSSTGTAADDGTAGGRFKRAPQPATQ